MNRAKRKREKSRRENTLGIKVAKQVGYCYGVERALDLAFKATRSYPKPIFTLGPIIHNPQVVESLRKQGIFAVSGLEKIGEGTVIIRSHGIDPKVISKARGKGLEVLDATCPFVKKAQQMAAGLAKEGYYVVIVGERDHPEILSILAHVGERALVAEKIKDLSSLPKAVRKIGVVVQTTQSVERLEEIVSALLRSSTELKVYNTICHATTRRQKEAEALTEKVDVMLVVGGKNSANTTRLAQICREAGTPTHHIETASDIDPKWLKNNPVVGVTTGASTSQWILKEVVDSLKKMTAKKEA